jgi:class 3 adenylate cyclase/tetratricopeptide (TPR) repeat protein
MMSDREHLEQAIAAQEGLRGTLDDTIIDATIAALRKQLEELNTAGKAQHRKLVTILFMDIVGSTEMVRLLDPEDNLAIMDTALNRLSEPVEEHGGRVTRYMGDGFLAVFGLPVANENDPVMAVHAGLGILAMAEAYAGEVEEKWDVEGFSVRVGIDTGPVVAGGRSEGEDTIAGSAVNLAARLESAALPGTLLISRHTYQHVRGAFEFQPHEPVQAKGFPEPVQVYKVLRARERSFRTKRRGVEGIETNMVGRDSEMKILQDAYFRVVEDGERQMVTIVGEAGLGKSRLLYETQNWIDSQSQQVSLFRGRARLEARRLPYGLLRDLFAFHFAIQDDETDEIVRQKILAGFSETLPVGETQSQITMRAHFVGHLLGYDFGASPHLESVKGDPQQLRDRVLLYLVDYFKAASRQDPVLVLLEDLQWADDSSLDLIARLILALGEHPVLLMGAARPGLYERRPHWLEGRAFHRRLDLHPLSRRDSRRLVEEVLQKVEQVPSTLRELLVSNAEGNPFYIEELIKMLVEDGIIGTGEEHWTVRLDQLEEVHVPPTLTGVLQARLDRLPEKERLVLQQASVVGRVFWDAVVAHLNRSVDGGLAEDAVRHGLEALLKREMVYHRDLSALAGVEEYIFKHAILREVTYESVLKKARQSYHAVVAEWLVQHSSQRVGELTAIIAGHLEQAGKQAEAFEYLRQAGTEAAATFANEEAADYYSRAFALAPTDDLESRYALLLARERAYDSLGARPEQRQDLEKLEALAEALDDVATGLVALSPETASDPSRQDLGPANRRVEVALRQAALARQIGDYPAVIEAAQKAIVLAEEAGDWVRVARGHLAWGRALWIRGEEEQGQAKLKQALAVSREAGDRRTEGRTLLLLESIAKNQGAYDTAKGHQEQVLAIFREIGDRKGEAATLRQIGNDESDRGEYAAATGHFKQALAIAREIANWYEEAALLNNLGYGAHRQGDYPTALAYLEQALAIGRQMDHPAMKGLVLSNHGLVAEALGNYAAALDYQRTALTVARKIGHSQREATALNGLGDALAGLGQWTEAEASFREAVDMWDTLGRLHTAAESRAGLARVALAQGDAVAALSQVETILAFLQSGGRLQGAENTMRIYLTCVQVLMATGDPRTEEFLDTTHSLLQERAANRADEAARRIYLENIPWHREIIALWEAQQGKSGSGAGEVPQI